ncbi:ABC transporter substrate-binding protein [Corynebacterium auris]|uniref:ABC transporter substrate-binding protein n=1 Tax=Corynebacterium auris TaxID=44750 RepID=UPI0025B4CA16|nr:ABC transporter substrate-binding protein [Corynebacterium auris]WJY68755.1 Periplasmic binding protein [Corynebacterium auris]
MSSKVSLVVLAAASLALCSCAGEEQGRSESAPSGASEPVTLAHPSFDGAEIEFESQPEELVMDCYAYSSLHEYGLTPAALFGYDCEDPFVMGDLDISGIARIGTNAEIDMEKLAEIGPDAVVGNGSLEGWTWFDETVNAQLRSVAPFVPLPRDESVEENIAQTRYLADFFGGDVDSAQVQQSDEELEQAKVEFQDVMEGSDLSFMLVSPTQEMLYTAVGFPQADFLESLGARIVGAPEPESGNPWGRVAWEEAASYPADILLVEGYDESYSFDNELWNTLPAVQAGQLGPWASKGAMTSRSYAQWLREVTELAASAEKVA